MKNLDGSLIEEVNTFKDDSSMERLYKLNME